MPPDVDEQPEQPEPLEDPPEVPDAPEQSLDNPFDDESTLNLAQAIMLMTQELRCRENTPSSHSIGKVKEPDTFDGSNPRKLNNFILLCNLYF